MLLILKCRKKSVSSSWILYLRVFEEISSSSAYIRTLFFRNHIKCERERKCDADKEFDKIHPYLCGELKSIFQNKFQNKLKLSNALNQNFFHSYQETKKTEPLNRWAASTFHKILFIFFLFFAFSSSDAVDKISLHFGSNISMRIFLIHNFFLLFLFVYELNSLSEMSKYEFLP